MSCAGEVREGGEGSDAAAMYRLLTERYDVSPPSARVLAMAPGITPAIVQEQASMITEQARDPPAVLATNLAKRLGVTLPASRLKQLERTVGPERAAGILKIEERRKEFRR
jgi:hypothetical protein